MTAPSASLTVPRTVAACAASANRLDRSRKQRGLGPGWTCVMNVIFPPRELVWQNRSPDLRLDESELPSQGLRPQWLRRSACPILGDYSYGVVADSHRASRTFCCLVFVPGVLDRKRSPLTNQAQGWNCFARSSNASIATGLGY